MKIYHWLPFASLFIAGIAQATEPAGLGLVVETALSHNAGLKAADAQVHMAQATRREAKALRLPILSARSRFMRSDQPVYVFGSLMEQGRFGPANFAIDALNHPGDLTNIQSGLDLGFPLFTGLQLTSAARLSELAESEARSGYSGASQRLRLEAATLYLQRMLNRDILAILEERLAAADSELSDARRLKDKGLVLGSDYYAAEAIQSALQGWRVQVQTDQSTVQAKLSGLTGRENALPAEAFPDSLPSLPAEAELIHTALEKRPDLQRSAYQLAMAQENSRQAARTLLPKVQAFASLETNTNDFSYNPTNHAFGIAAELPFGDPAYLSRRSRSSAAQEAARQNQRDIENTIQTDVAQAYAAYRGALSGIPVAKETLSRAAKSLDLFRPLYRSGRQSIMEVLRAEEGMARAQAAYRQALFHAAISWLSLKAAAGELDDKAIADLSRSMEARP